MLLQLNLPSLHGEVHLADMKDLAGLRGSRIRYAIRHIREGMTMHG